MPTGERIAADQVALDRRMMHRAIALAARGRGRVEPNPTVGAVLVSHGRIIAEGFHRHFGGPHAEADVLGRGASKVCGATLYVSLEPCCHHGKTPPCTDAIIEAGVARVVIGVRDPNPLVRGKGVRALRRAGIAVDVGVCGGEAGECIAPFATLVNLQRPYVIAKWAQSLDGKLATRTGDSKWISGEASRRESHRLRARVDAILVGSRTVRADDPMLDARGVRVRRHAARVVVDSRLAIPLTSRLVATAGALPTLLLTTAPAGATPRARRLRRLGVDVIVCRSRRGRVALEDAMHILAARHITNLMVEGGPTLLTALLTAGFVDEAWVFTAPILIGGVEALSVLGGRGVKEVAGAGRPRHVESRRFGPDRLDRLRLTRPPV